MANPNSFLESLGTGAPLPPVSPEDLKHLGEFIKSIRGKTEMISGLFYRPGIQGQQTVGIDRNLMAEHCSAGANVEAVCFRYAIMQLLIQQGILAPWQHGDEIDDFIFQVFAAYPFQLGTAEWKLDTDALLQHIRDSRANP